MNAYRILTSAGFDFPTLQAVATTYEHVRVALDLDPTDPLREVVAHKIVEHAKAGERDWRRLHDAVLKELRGRTGQTIGGRSRHFRWLARLTPALWRRR